MLEALGSPIEEGFLVTGRVSTSSQGGTANLAIPIHGPKGSATLHVRGIRFHGVWRYTTMTVTLDSGGSVIDLLAQERTNV